MQTQCFYDFDHFATSVRGVESKMMFRNPLHRQWIISHATLGDIDIQVGKLGSGNLACGQMHTDGVIVYAPITKEVEYVGNGAAMDTRSLFVMEPGAEFCISTKVEHDWCCAKLPRHLIEKEGVTDFSASCRVVRPGNQVATRFRTMVSDIITMASVCSEFESSAAADRAAADVFELVSRAVDYRQCADHTRAGRPKYSRDEIIDRALGHLSGRRENSVRIAELTNASDVSERTLRAAFHEYFGMGPVKYLRLRQLHSVRRSLLAADPNQTTVSSVLMDHEEWAFSRFAADYRRLFGELPSATLRR